MIWQKAASLTCHPLWLRMDSSDLDPNLTHGSLNPHDSAPKRHLDRFTRLCAAHLCSQHTDRRTDHDTCDICVHTKLPKNKV